MPSPASKISGEFWGRVGRWQEADINQAKYDKSQRCPAAVCSLSGMIAHLEFEVFWSGRRRKSTNGFGIDHTPIISRKTCWRTRCFCMRSSKRPMPMCCVGFLCSWGFSLLSMSPICAGSVPWVLRAEVAVDCNASRCGSRDTLRDCAVALQQFCHRRRSKLPLASNAKVVLVYVQRERQLSVGKAPPTADEWLQSLARGQRITWTCRDTVTGK